MVKIMTNMEDGIYPIEKGGQGGLALQKNQSSVSPSASQLLSQGALEHRNVLEDWIDHIISFVGKDVDFSQYTIVADGGNGAA